MTKTQFAILLVSVVLAYNAHADLGSEIRSRCSISALNQQDNARFAAQGNLIEERKMHEYVNAAAGKKPAAGSEVAVNAESLNHQRTQVKVQEIKFAQSKCMLGLIQTRLGSDMTFSQMKDNPKAKALMRELDTFVKGETDKLNAIRDELVKCRALTDNIAQRNCKLKQLEIEIGHFEAQSLATEMHAAIKSIWPAWQNKSLSAYEQERLADIRSLIGELNDDLTQSGDRFTPVSTEAEGTR